MPSIVSDINGCNEIIVENHNGVIVPVKDSDSLRAEMEKMILDKDYFQALKTNARPMIEDRFEQSVIWNAILSEYNKLIKEREYRV